MRALVYWFPAVLYMGLIWTLSSLELAGDSLAAFPFKDKGIHFVEYAGLAFLLLDASRRTWPAVAPARTFIVAVIIAVAWGTLDELHQAFVPTRSADVADLVADSLGAFAGASMRLILSAVFRRGAQA